MKQARRFCETCGSNITPREIALYRGMIVALWRAFQRCKSKGSNLFKMRDVRDVLGQVTYTRFGDWVLFGGLVYKEKKAHYGLNMERCEAFFSGELEIPSRVLKDPITKKVVEKVDYRTVDQIPKLKALLDEEGVYKWRYRERDRHPELFA